ncbi:hypothetical protein GCM10017576_23500 [Microbacterium barkeri]|uniref:Uncharacterized protein n=1 Tax=Microbacterium barkeri TaxID=33917 RepID=A0A9W6H471_9MICO|nr:hypothetical protein [Microbacterium barkeri]MDI6944207.1 hypothetical protein [Microbacterium barkeri]MDR6876779.1 hypothetical protein [Microbacterium barkeri]GLJ62220.1 hypothetical protein GCM10017576_23500 [Microbacterium barkeri]
MSMQITDQETTERLWFRFLHFAEASAESVEQETPQSLALWTQANAHRIYDAMAARGWLDDSTSREALFELAAHVLGIDYGSLYDAWLEGTGA